MVPEVGEKQQQQEQPPPAKLQIYSTSNGEISSFWREKYERDAKKYWDIFYKRHQDKFFKDRHYLDKEWGHYFLGAGKVILEVGCGVGNTIFPLLATYPNIFVHACDFSPRAVNLVKMHKDFKEARVNAFVCDLTVDDLTDQVSAHSVDVVTMIFVLSAVSPEKMHLVLQNIRKILKPSGCILFRDYAIGDLAQERFRLKEQRISENFYVRGDGTRAFYFSDEFLTSLFKEHGFHIEEHVLCCKQVENRSRELIMNRRWVQAVFRVDGGKSSKESGDDIDILEKDHELPVQGIIEGDTAEDIEIDMSDGMATEMFGISSSTETVEVTVKSCCFNIKVLPKEYQHTCKSTGLMLWESARLMASLLAANHTIVQGKRVLELGSGCSGICSMVSAKHASLVVATDGDQKALDLLTQNVASNLESPYLERLITRKLEWGNAKDIGGIKQMNNRGFEVIIGTDVTYIPEAIMPLFETAAELISSARGVYDDSHPALILCHVLRRVDEPSILSAASHYGFMLADRWPQQAPTIPSQSIIENWFVEDGQNDIPSTALSVMYFQKV